MSQDDHDETKENKKLLSASQAAFQLGITKADVSRLREQGKLTGVRGKWGRWFYHPDALAAVFTETPATETAAASPSPEEPPTVKRSIAAIMNEIGPGTRGGEDDAVEERAASEQAPIIRMANAILVQAIEARASDIHIEPESRYVLIRFRIDGVLHEIMKVPNYIKGPLIRRYKIMAGINLLEMRIPQAGNVPLKHCGKDYDMRVTTFPSRYGENVTMRILHSGNLLGLNKMGMSPDVQADVESILFDYPSGLILIAGPRGSGLTTTAYNLLRKIHSVEKKIVTLEALAEYYLPGALQSYYGGEFRSSFSEALRLLPLMDVDALFLSDINTPEAKSGAIDAALSGTRVIATMAAEDACMALWRLSQQGVLDDSKGKAERTRVHPLSYSYSEQPGIPLQQTLRGVLAQRLVRLICSDCKGSYSAVASELIPFGFSLEMQEEAITLFRGKGCDTCRGSGYRGRIGIYELMTINSEVAELVSQRAPLAHIKDAARANGMRDLREDGLVKVLDGRTTPDEVLRVLGPQKYQT